MLKEIVVNGRPTQHANAPATQEIVDLVAQIPLLLNQNQ